MSFRALTVNLGSSGSVRPLYLEAARTLGETLARNGIDTVYGGMDAGMMNALAEGALNQGGSVRGIIPRRIADFDRYHKGLTHMEVVDDMWERKQRLFHAGDAILILPGGYGTLDEAFEILYWATLTLHRKPLVFVNISGYWDSILTFLENIPDLSRKAWVSVNRIQDILPALEKTGQTLPHDDITITPLPHFEANSQCDTHLPVIIDSPVMGEVCRFMTALILKQLGKHTRPIGILNRDSAFDPFLSWTHMAAQEKFLTPKCLRLFSCAKTERALFHLLETTGPVMIDLHKEKWGQR